MALKWAAGHELTAKFGIEIVPEEASMGDSSGNGLAKHAVRGESEDAMPRTWVGKVAGRRAGANSPCRHVVDSVVSDDNRARD